MLTTVLLSSRIGDPTLGVQVGHTLPRIGPVHSVKFLSQTAISTG